MKIVLLIICIIIMISRCLNAHIYKTSHFEHTKKEPYYTAMNRSRFGWFIGSLISFAIGAAACWYVIDYFVKL